MSEYDFGFTDHELTQLHAMAFREPIMPLTAEVMDLVEIIGASRESVTEELNDTVTENGAIPFTAEQFKMLSKSIWKEKKRERAPKQGFNTIVIGGIDTSDRERFGKPPSFTMKSGGTVQSVYVLESPVGPDLTFDTCLLIHYIKEHAGKLKAKIIVGFEVFDRNCGDIETTYAGNRFSLGEIANALRPLMPSSEVRPIKSKAGQAGYIKSDLGKISLELNSKTKESSIEKIIAGILELKKSGVKVTKVALEGKIGISRKTIGGHWNDEKIQQALLF